MDREKSTPKTENLSLEELEAVTGGFSLIDYPDDIICLPMYGIKPPVIPITKYGIVGPNLPILYYGIVYPFDRK